jgi:hypothetical protein
MYVLTCFYFRLYPLVDEKRLTEFTTGATFPLAQLTGNEFQITFPEKDLSQKNQDISTCWTDNPASWQELLASQQCLQWHCCSPSCATC